MCIKSLIASQKVHEPFKINWFDQALYYTNDLDFERGRIGENVYHTFDFKAQKFSLTSKVYYFMDPSPYLDSDSNEPPLTQKI